jgi:hypothetical protein
MADDAAASAALQRLIDDKLATLQAVEQEAAAARVRVRAIALLLEEEQDAVAALDAKVVAAAQQIPSSSAAAPTPPPIGDESAVIANLHAQACSVQNIRNMIGIVLDPSSTNYARWRDQVMLTLERYELAAHVLLDTPPANDPSWKRMDNVVVSWIFGTISIDLQDIARARGISARQTWLTLENQFIGNSETRALHLDTMFRNFVQGDLSMTEYYRKMKAMADSLGDLDCPVLDRNVVLNVLRGLNKKYEHLRAIITLSRPFPSFLKLRDDLVLEELQLGPDTTSAPPQAFYSNNSQTPSSSRPPGSGGQGRGRGHGKGGRGSGANHHRQGGHTVGPARNQANGSTSAIGVPAPWLSLYDPWTGTISMYPGPTMGELQQPSRPQQQQVFLTAPGQPVGLSQHTTPLAPIPVSAQLYAAQQQHQLQQQAQAAYGAQQQQQVAQTPWNPWQGT